MSGPDRFDPGLDESELSVPDLNEPVLSEPVLDHLAAMWAAVDPAPEGLIARMQAVTAAEVVIADSDLDYELLLMIERSYEIVGARGGAAYTLRFGTLRFGDDDLDLLVRAGGASTDSSSTRIDGWVVPPGKLNVRVQPVASPDVLSDEHGAGEWLTQVDDHGRFEFSDLPHGLVRLWLLPTDGSKPFATPPFEV